MVQQSFTDLHIRRERDQHKGVTISKTIHSLFFSSRRKHFTPIMNQAEAL